MVRYSPYMLLQKKGPDGVMWRETDYHKQKELEKRNPIFRRGGRNDKFRRQRNLDKGKL